MCVYFFDCKLQHTATYCNTLQHTATHCNNNVKSRVFVDTRRPWPLRCCCSVLRCFALCCSVLQCVAVSLWTLKELCGHSKTLRLRCLRCCCCSVLQCMDTRRPWPLRCCCRVLQCAAVHCSVLQCVAVRCVLYSYLEQLLGSLLQCVAVCCSMWQCGAVCCSMLQ